MYRRTRVVSFDDSKPAIGLIRRSSTPRDVTTDINSEVYPIKQGEEIALMLTK